MTCRKFIPILLTLLLGISTAMASAAGTVGVDGTLQIQNPFPLSIPNASSQIDISASLPSSVTLGLNDTVTWSASATMETTNGWMTSFSTSSGTYEDGYFQINSLGRRATITFIPPELSGDYTVDIQAVIGSHTYDISGNVHVESNQDPRWWLDSILATKYTILNPSVGNDSQTTIGFIGSGVTDVTPINWKGEPLTGGGYSYGSTMKFQVNYLDYLNQGFGLKVHLFSCSTWSMECLDFYKTVPVIIDFPPPTQSVSVSCDDVYIEKETFCNLYTSSTDPAGIAVQQGQNVKIAWSESVDGAITKSGSVDGVIGADTQVAIGPETKPIIFSAKIVGQSVEVTTTALPHIYSLLETVGVVWNFACKQSAGVAKCIAKPSVVPKADFDMPTTIPLQVVSDSSGIQRILISESITPNQNYSFSVPVNTKLQSLNVRVSASDSGVSWSNSNYSEPLTPKNLKLSISCPSNVSGNTFSCAIKTSTTASNNSIISIRMQYKTNKKGWTTYKTSSVKVGGSLKGIFPNPTDKDLYVRASVKTSAGVAYSSVRNWSSSSSSSSSSEASGSGNSVNSNGIDISSLPAGHSGTTAYQLGVTQAHSFIDQGGLTRAQVGNIGGIPQSCKFILDTFMALNGGSSTKQQYADFMLGCTVVVKAWY